MAQRKPLVVVSGVVQELPPADTLAPSVGDLLTWDSRVKGVSGWGAYYPYFYGSNGLGYTGSTAGNTSSGVFNSALGNNTSFTATHNSVSLNSAASSYSGVFLGSATCELYRQGGLMFDSAVELGTNTAHCGFVGLVNRGSIGGNGGTGIYSSLGNSDLCIGIGRDEGDPANAAYLFVGNGTTRTKTLLTRTGGGYSASDALKFQVQITCAPGASAMTMNVVDLSNNYPCLANYAVSLSGFPTDAAFSACSGSATGASTTAATIVFYGVSFSPYPGSENFATSASNITGNAATATELATPRNIQGVPFDGTANIDVISIGTTAPASPVLNQLWIQT